jgi:acetyl-CoA C-acetyltransferase
MPPEAAFIYDAVRTPRGKGKRDGALHEFKPVTLLTGLLKAIEQRNALDTAAVDDVVMGVVNPLGEQGSVIAKSAAQLAGWNADVCGLQVNRFCASGLEAVSIAANRVAGGTQGFIVAGGVESMSRVPMGSDGGPWVEDPETAFVTDFIPQGISADLIANVAGHSRQALDGFAVASHQKAAAAQRDGAFRSIVPVSDGVGLPVLAHDELVRPKTDAAALARLDASFAGLGTLGFDDVALRRYPSLRRIEHLHTPGNSSAIADAASAILIGGAAAGARLGLKPRARIVATALAGTDPTIMLTGPAPATMKLLKAAGLTLEDIDLFEVNEAFAAVVLRFMEELGVPADKVNVNGGAIAMGHPLGATGGILIATLLDELERRDAKRGIVTLCAGGGMGIATLIERV